MFLALKYPTADAWVRCAQKRVLVFGMSGLGKTYISNILRESKQWYHYSVDYRIGTRYMGEEISDFIKQEAMKSPMLAQLLRSDSICIESNIGFENLDPLSCYLGKPGAESQGGLPFREFVARQKAHIKAEKAALMDTEHFATRSEKLYGYPHFICDTGGSICEAVDPEDPKDPVLTHLAQSCLLVWIRGSEADIQTSLRRFKNGPKPMCYNPEFLYEKWQTYLRANDLTPEQVSPDDFIISIYEDLLHYRQPIYAKIAQNWGVDLAADIVAKVRSADDFVGLIHDALATKEIQ